MEITQPRPQLYLFLAEADHPWPNEICMFAFPICYQSQVWQRIPATHKLTPVIIALGGMISITLTIPNTISSSHLGRDHDRIAILEIEDGAEDASFARGRSGPTHFRLHRINKLDAKLQHKWRAT